MAGYLLARAGIEVVVLEKHADFFRDFRGDTIHPSTLQIMDELGLLDDLLKIPHTQARELSGIVGGTQLTIADFSAVPGRSKFIALMPQWDLLNFLVERARRFAGFRLEMNAQAVDLVREGERVRGVIANAGASRQTIFADLVIAADGRHSVLRERSGLHVRDFGAPMDVLWMRLPRKASDPGTTFGNVAAGGVFVMIDRTDYYQCALVIAKNGYAALKARGLEALRQHIARIAPLAKDRVSAIESWDDVKLLTVVVDRLEKWYLPGLLCIGDAAHAMSPIAGVGINLAIQDAVATANILWQPLKDGTLRTTDLEKVAQRREAPARQTQRLQVFIQNRLIRPVLSSTKPLRAPRILKWIASIAWFRQIPARVVGVGFRPEHVRSPEQ
ncbi:MAG: FAD-dependent oxidoreductase [Candidatus Eremiobacteraeota bacterium]|nr:FAD-dependent oxidoreductase [Candidatus Eremiobacteraeota bacterium]